jgi:putative ABC transport system permease protein
MISPRWWKVIRDVWDNKSRTVLVVLSIAIGVFAFGGLFITRVLAEAELDGQYQRTNSPQIAMSLPPFDDHFVAWMARQEHVSGAQGRASYSVKLVDSVKTHNLMLLAYKDFTAIDIGRISPQEGEWPPEKDEILLERSTLALTNLKIGDPVIIEMVDGRRFTLTLAGTVHDMNAVPGTVQSQVTGYVTFRTLDRLELPPTFNQIEVTIDYDYLHSRPQPVLDTLNEIANDLQLDLQRSGTRAGSVRVRESDKHWASDIMGGIATILVIVGLGSLFLSGFLVVNTISGLLMQQKRQIGVMKIIGASRPQIIGIYLVMVVFLGLMALVIAIPASMALAHMLLFSVMAGFLNFDILNFHLPPVILILQVAVAILSPVLSALVPILNGTSMTAAAAISDYSSQGRSGFFDVALARIRGLSRPMLLSLRNTFRRKARLVMTLITLTSAGTLFMSIMNVRTGLELDVNDRLRMSDFDVQVFLNGLYDREGLERRLEQMPGVDEVEGWAQTSVQRIRSNGGKSGTFVVYGLPYNSIFINPPIQSGEWLQAPERVGQNDLVVTTEWIDDEPDVQVGDVITLDLNGEEEDWNVVGILISAASAVYANYDDVTHFLKRPNETSLMLIRTVDRDTAFAAGVTDDLLEFLDLRNIGVGRSVTQAQLINDTVGGFDILVSVLIGMAIIVAVVGGLGLAGTMSLNVLERTREIGVMRAVGASTGTIRRLFIVEGVLIGILSAIVALPLSVPSSIGFGTVLGEVLANRPLPYAPTLEGPALWFAIIMFISAAASVMPAQRASQISVREALAYE